MDERIVNHVITGLLKHLGKGGSKIDHSLMATIREAAEEAKIALSEVESITISIPFVGQGKLPFTMNLTRDTFESLIQDLIEKTKGPIEQALEDSSLDKSDIDDILLVGGTTLIPAVKRFVSEFFGKEPLCRDPYTAVALGAAIAGLEHVSEKSRIAKNIDISDVVSSSLGVKIADGTLSKVIERNTKIPIARTRMYTNAGDFTPEVIIPVYQGDEEMADDNEFLGHFFISIEPMPAEENKIEVTFEIGEEFGILNVRAKDSDSGNERSVKFESRSKLSKKEKDKWMKKVAGIGSVHVQVLDSSETTNLDMYLNPSLSVSDLKLELKQKGMMEEDEILICNDEEPADELRISDLGLEDGMTLVVRSRDGE